MSEALRALIERAETLGYARTPVDHGATCGNAFLLFHHGEGQGPFESHDSSFWSALAQWACHQGPRVDDTIHTRLHPKPLTRKGTKTMQAHADFIIVGGDGRKATQCGNGLIYGAWCIHARTGRMRICFNCSGRIREASLRRGIWILDLGAPSVCAWSGGQVPGLATEPLLIDTGEPHAVSLEEDLSGRLVDFEILGAEVCSRYDPEGVNWTLIWPRSDHIFIRTFERGVRRSTTSCGTGAAAAFHAMRCHGRPPGDSLSVRSHGGVHIVSGRSESVLIGAAPSHFSSSTLGTLLAQWIY